MKPILINSLFFSLLPLLYFSLRIRTESPNILNMRVKSEKEVKIKLLRLGSNKSIESMLTEQIDNSESKDCPAEVMLIDWEHFKELYPKKAEACSKLWKENQGLPGEKIMEEFAKIDSNFNKDACPTKDEFDELEITDPKLVDLSEKLMPNTFTKCRNIWASSGNTNKVSSLPEFSDLLNGYKSFDNLFSGKERKSSRAFDNSNSDDCPPKFSIQHLIEIYQEHFPKKVSTCKELWKVNNDFPGEKFIKETSNKDLSNKECPNESIVRKSIEGKDFAKNLSILKRLIPHSFSRCKNLLKLEETEISDSKAEDSQNKSSRKSNSHIINIFSSLGITHPFDNSSNIDCPPKFMVSNKWETMKTILPLKYKACNEFWKGSNDYPGQEFIDMFVEVDKERIECPYKNGMEAYIKNNEDTLKILRILLPYTFKRCKNLSEIKIKK